MQRHIVASLTQAILVIFGVLILVFFMVRLNGDPTHLMLARGAPPEQIAEFRHRMGFDRPLPVQFLDFATHAIVGDFGNSLHYRLPVLQLILERLPATLQLAVTALLFSLFISLPLGLFGGSRPGSIFDTLARALGLIGQVTPPFWLGLVLIIIFAVQLGWLPTSGRETFASVIMPAFVLGLSTMGRLVQITRSSILEIMREDYIRTANSKGLSPRTIYFRHALKNAAIPLIGVIGVEFGYMIGGSVIVESIFAWPGMERMAIEAISNRDFPLVQGIAFFTSIIVVGLNLLSDIAYAFVDPRIRYE